MDTGDSTVRVNKVELCKAVPAGIYYIYINSLLTCDKSCFFQLSMELLTLGIHVGELFCVCNSLLGLHYTQS